MNFYFQHCFEINFTFDANAWIGDSSLTVIIEISIITIIRVALTESLDYGYYFHLVSLLVLSAILTPPKAFLSSVLPAIGKLLVEIQVRWFEVKYDESWLTIRRTYIKNGEWNLCTWDPRRRL